jgi:ribosomal protein L44E
MWTFYITLNFSISTKLLVIFFLFFLELTSTTIIEKINSKIKSGSERMQEIRREEARRTREISEIVVIDPENKDSPNQVIKLRKRVCYSCKEKLMFMEYMNANPQYIALYLEKLWNNDKVELYCCACLHNALEGEEVEFDLSL